MGKKIKGKVKHREHRILFSSGLYRQRIENDIKDYKRNDKHKGRKEDDIE